MHAVCNARKREQKKKREKREERRDDFFFGSNLCLECFLINSKKRRKKSKNPTAENSESNTHKKISWGQMALKRILPIVDALGCGFDGNVVELRGWVRSIRRQKRVSFLELNDGSTSSNVQVVTPSDLLPKDVSAGSSVCVSGLMRASGGWCGGM